MALPNNTTALESILEQVNNLPEAGGSGTLETCTLEFITPDPVVPSEFFQVIYIGSDGTTKMEQWIANTTTLTVAKDTHVVVRNCGSNPETKNLTLLYNYMGLVAVYQINGNAIFEYFM